MPAFTLRALVEQLRRSRFGILTPWQERQAGTPGFEAAQEGDCPDWARIPTTEEIVDCVGCSVADLNMATGGLSPETVRLSVAAQTDDGPCVVELTGGAYTPGSVGGGAIDQVRDAYWEESDGTPRWLRPVDLSNLARDRLLYQSYAPGVPTRYAIEGLHLSLIPAPDTAGTLVLRVGVGVMAPLTLDGTFVGLPDDCANALVDIVAATVCEGHLDNPDYAARYPALARRSEQSRRLILSTLVRYNGRRDGRMTVTTYRRGGLRRG